MASVTEMKHWKKPDQLQIVKENGFGYKFFRKSDVERRIDEGWEIVNKRIKAVHESAPVDQAEHYRGLILMRMPIHMIEERNAYYLKKHTNRLRSAAQGAAVAAKAGDINRGVGDELTGALGRGLDLREGVRTEEGLSHSKNTHIDVEGAPDSEADADLAKVHEAQRASEGGHASEGKGKDPRKK